MLQASDQSEPGLTFACADTDSIQGTRAVSRRSSAEPAASTTSHCASEPTSPVSASRRRLRHSTGRLPTILSPGGGHLLAGPLLMVFMPKADVALRVSPQCGSAGPEVLAHKTGSNL